MFFRFQGNHIVTILATRRCLDLAAADEEGRKAMTTDNKAGYTAQDAPSMHTDHLRK